MLKIFVYAVTTLLVFMGSWVFVSKRKHLLGTLLSLEFIMLSLYMMVFVYVLTLGYELYFMMMFLTMVVCEGALGLSILVSMIRTHGNDYFQSFNILQC
uniref:NADH dehydrogenase subunit 4L n=1 Tax=Deleatidium vernale TaxID=1968931 RepID=UPI0028D51214|nr:NADH dehydrogenase subunit 4L [Deleatidium vernale]WMQ76566.1 NADH dehydrogenase subunit 4L [Deleatidium vernale]